MHESDCGKRLQGFASVLGLSALLIVAGTVHAAKPDNVTRGELALLPEYCADTQTFGYGDQYTNPSPRAPHWISLMGPTFWHFHHYCWSLIWVARSNAIGLPPVLRQGYLNNAVDDYFYVLRNATPGFVMLPEVFTRLGEAQVALGKVGDAMESFAAARKAKPDYWPPYVRWADVLGGIGKRKEARTHLEEILRLTPEEPAVLAAYRKHGGDPAAFLRSLPPSEKEPASTSPAQATAPLNEPASQAEGSPASSAASAARP